jgi:Mrp family chromosome partitioning ATPase
MQQLNADLAGLKRQISGEVQKFVVSLEKEAKAASIRVDAVGRQIADLKGRVMSTSGDDAKLRALEANVKAKRAELERLQRQLEDNNTVVVTKTVPIEARIISPARASSVPVFPKKGPFSLLAMAATFMLGLAWIVTRELLVGARPTPSGSAGGSGSGKRSLVPQSRQNEPALAAGSAGAVTATAVAAAAPIRAEIPSVVAEAPTFEDADASAPLSIVRVADTLIEKAGEQGGHRTLITGYDGAIDAGSEAIALCNSLASTGRSVVLVDWSLEGRGLAQLAGVPEKPGVTDLLAGRASFEDVVTRIPNSEVHMMASGAALVDADVLVDSDGLNLVLDALDEAYDHIVVAAPHDEARRLLEAIQGRFDAGITVSDSARRVSVLDNAHTFLGFEVAGIEIIRFIRPQPSQPVVAPSKAKADAGAKGGDKAKAAKPAPAAVADDEQPFVASSTIPASRLQLARGGKPSSTRPSA